MHEPVAVLMYHSVAPAGAPWDFDFLSLPPDVFEDQIAGLERRGYTGITLSELHAYVSGTGRIPPKSVVITFDDGYLDNWVFAFPILRKYGFRATVFISTDFIDRSDTIRPTTADITDGRVRPEDLEWRGFLSPAEMQRMLNSDLIEIQGHCKTHTWYFTSDKIEDFHHPGDRRPWLAWNARPDRKPLYPARDQSEFVPWGSPVYEHRGALVARRYFPDPRVEADLREAVIGLGGRDFFRDPEWRKILHERAAAIAAGGLNDRLETDAERHTRLREEIILSKQELADVIGRPVEFLAWPGGGYDETCVEMAREAGYRAWTMAGAAKSGRRNVPGENPEWIRRLAVPPRWYSRGRKICHVDGEFLERLIGEFRGGAFAGFRLRWYKMEKYIESLFSP